MTASWSLYLRKVGTSPRGKYLILGLVGSIFLLLALPKTTKVWKRSCWKPHSRPDGGDCGALGGPRRPEWACYSAMRSEVPKFVRLYKRRPIKSNTRGMRLQHSFALYYILRQLQPTTVIESGVRNGHSTWIIRQALPHARIISLDPKRPWKRLPRVNYFVGDEFVDFGDVAWRELGVDPERTLVFLDDHQDAFKRMFKQNRIGFRHFITEDNYDYLRGDAQSLSWICQTRNRSTWPGYALDNFGKKKKMSWDDHLVQSKTLHFALETYYKFPPVAAKDIIRYPKFYPKTHSPPIIRDHVDYRRVIRNIPVDELHQRGNLAYAAIRPGPITHYEYE